MKTKLQQAKDLCEYYFRACEYLERPDVSEDDKKPVREQLTKPLEEACKLFNEFSYVDANKMIEWYNVRDAACMDKIHESKGGGMVMVL